MSYTATFLISLLFFLGPLATDVANHEVSHPSRHNERECPHKYVEGEIIIPESCPLVLECSGNGLFAPNQCRSDGMCFCVNVTLVIFCSTPIVIILHFYSKFLSNLRIYIPC